MLSHIKKTEKKNIEKAISENFMKLMPSFYEMQSLFLSGVYKRYGDLEGGHIVIYFARDLHLQILRKREKDLSFNLSLDEFWNNHKNIHQNRQKIISVSKNTGLPKETTRRKIISLIKKKHLKKGEKNKIFWEPASDLKSTYIKVIEEQIRALSKFVYEQFKILNIPVPFGKIEKEIKKNYSFYWYHYLTVQLEWIKFWQTQLKDLEVLLIGLQTLIKSVNLLSSKIDRDLDSFVLGKIPKNIKINQADISATSISEVTSIPRATCIRKLEKLVKMNVLRKDKINKRYYLSIENLSSNPNFDFVKSVKTTVSIFSNFSVLIFKSLVK